MGFTSLKFLESGRVLMNGSAQSISIPSGTIYAELSALGGDVTFDVDKDASATSQMLFDAAPVRRVWLSGAAALSVYGSAGDYVYYIFYGT